MATYPAACITDLQRMPYTRLGNPQWKITFVTQDAEVITTTTKANASVAGTITPAIVDTFATITTTPAGRITGIVRD